LYDYLQHFFSFTGNTNIYFKDDAKSKIATDENYLKTIMHNLTSNAVKAAKDKTLGSIVWNAWAADGKQFLSITETDPGMKPEQANTLNDTSAATNARSGFGFHLIRDLAKAIDCEISMQSQPDAGTCFTLCFNNR
jgi:sensor histidine kinase regulating citrate/malate metabolism